jgi:signal transduction histidine kinase
MRLKDIKIAILVKLSFGILLFLVIILVVVSYLQADKIHQQTEFMYKHPLKVRRAIDIITINALNMRIASNDLIFTSTSQEKHEANQIIASSSANVSEQFNILREIYLGPLTDVDEAFKSFKMWHNAYEEYLRLIVSNQIPPENESISYIGELTLLREKFENSIEKIDNSADNKSKELFVTANSLYQSLTKKLLLLIATFILLSFTSIYIILRNIQKPLAILINATQRFQDGEMDVHSPYESKNEFGILSASFNIMLESIQKNSLKLANQNRELESRKSELQVLSTQLLLAEEKVRKHIANDIHDSIGQVLSAIKFSVESSLVAINEGSYPVAVEALENIILLTKQSIDEVRRIIMDLRPSMLDDLGLTSTISWFCREFESIYSHIIVEKEINIDEAEISPSMKTVIYRILQEAMNNSAKHSKTDFILLQLLMKKDSLELVIEDKGVGFDIDIRSVNKGIGLASIKERAKMSGGIFNIQSHHERGTKIQISWPFSALSLE